tara:strand:- start:698 stop:2452 length:1755 start_codon:yes stop_codon:yes gene_type:complete
MATLLGEATLTSQFISTFDDVRVVTDDLNRVTTTAFRDPTTVHIQGEGVIDTRDYRAIYLPNVADYVDGGYFDTDYVFDDPIFSAGFASPGTSELLKVAYDFLDIDPAATINSVEVKIDFEPTEALGSDPNFGTLQMEFSVKGASGANNPISTPQTITSGDRQTMTFTIPASGTWPVTGLGEHHTLLMTGSGSFKAMRIYRLQARVNYTGRTRFTTGFKSYTTKSVTDFIPGTDTNPPPIPTESTRLYKTEGYGFAIPSDHTVDGVGMLYGFGAVVNGTHKEILHFKRDISGTHTRISTDQMQNIFGGFLSGGEANVYARLINVQDEDNSDTEITTAEVNDSTFGLEARFAYEFASTRPSEPVVFDINIAHVGPIISGDIGLSTVSTTTVGAVLTHAVASSEIATFASTFTTSTLGGFLLIGAPQTQASAVTTTVGTAGRIRPGESNINTAFTVTASAINDLTGSSISFPTATVTVSSAVARTTPATSNIAFTTVLGTAGMTRTNHAITPNITATVGAVSGISIIRAVDEERVFVMDTATRSYVIPQEIRTHVIPTHTRTHVMDEQVRTIDVDQQTRTTTVEGM